MAEARKLRVGVLISGSGTNLQALIDACMQPDFPAEIAVVISNKPDAKGLDRAKAVGIPTQVIEHTAYKRREDFDAQLQLALTHHLVDAVCLAGFMRLLTPGFVNQWHNRMLNIHPSLLPSFKGVHTHEAALAAGVKFHGCTVHFVRAEMDVGPIIVQAAVPVVPGDTAQTLAARVLEQEHRCYPLALEWLAKGRLEVVDERVRILGEVAVPDAVMNPF